MTQAHIYQRRALGILGIMLPFAVLLFGRLGDNGPYWYYSISASAYTNAAPWFYTTLGTVGYFLITYSFYAWKAYGKIDFFVNLASGACALVVAFFPCSTSAVDVAGLVPLPVRTCSVIHNAAAAGLFLLLAFNVLFLFTKTGGNPTAEKLKRNAVYRVCGYGMLVFIASQVVTSALKVPGPATMVNEAGMLLCFGVAWLVKGEAVMQDKLVSAK